jgi:hypothetical protein
MRPLTARAALTAWERGQGKEPLARSLVLLGAVFPGAPPDRLAALTLGQREAALLEARRRGFGPRLDGSARCPACGVALEFSLDARDLARQGAAGEDALAGTVEAGRWRVGFRLPTSADLAAAARAADLAEARAVLLERCVLEAFHGGEPADPGDLPEEVVAAVGAAMEELDPAAELPVDIACAACGHRWTMLLDAGLFLWTEVAALAERLLYEVNALATAYGWSEAEILELSPLRRRRYLELLPTA